MRKIVQRRLGENVGGKDLRGSGALRLKQKYKKVPWHGAASGYCSFSYSALARFRMGISGSASFQIVKKFWYAAFALAVCPASS